MSATWSGSRRPAVATSRARRAWAAPNQTAATAIPPQAKPGRLRYHSSSPTGTAATPSRRNPPLGTSTRPRETHVPGSGETPSPSEIAKARRDVGPVCAVMMACDRSAAREHHGLVPSSTQPEPCACGTASSRAPGPWAAYTPHVDEASAPTSARSTSGPAWSRIDRASRCGSRVRATVRSTEPSVARTPK